MRTRTLGQSDRRRGGERGRRRWPTGTKIEAPSGWDAGRAATASGCGSRRKAGGLPGALAGGPGRGPSDRHVDARPSQLAPDHLLQDPSQPRLRVTGRSPAAGALQLPVKKAAPDAFGP